MQFLVSNLVPWPGAFGKCPVDPSRPTLGIVTPSKYGLSVSGEKFAPTENDGYSEVWIQRGHILLEFKIESLFRLTVNTSPGDVPSRPNDSCQTCTRVEPYLKNNLVLVENKKYIDATL
jgi:hypothetical protein